MSRPDLALLLLFLLMAGVGGCGRGLDRVGQTPDVVSPRAGTEMMAMMTPSLPQTILPTAQPPALAPASLWTGERGSLLGDRRALDRGDILTVVIEINDSATLTNSSGRSRSGSQSMNVGALFGLPEMINDRLPGDASLTPGIELGGSSDFSGTGSVTRNEQLTLRMAATVTDVLPNGVLAIEGSQQVMVNYEMRTLVVSGFVRPADITRQNEITYDKIAAARIAYGGDGQITEFQQPTYGQQVTDRLSPF